MEMTQTHIETPKHADAIGRLERGEVVTNGGRAVKLTNRDSKLLVVGFSGVDDDIQWLDAACDEAGFALLHIAAPDGQSDQEIESFLREFADSDTAGNFDVLGICASADGYSTAVASCGILGATVLVAFDPVLKTADEQPPSCAAYVFQDPFSVHPEVKDVITSRQFLWLKCFGMRDSSARALSRMRLLNSLLTLALRNELEPDYFYHLIRNRKDYYFYRMGIEAALAARDQQSRLHKFRSRFRERRLRMNDDAKFEALKARAAAEKPDRPGAWTRSTDEYDAPRWPSAGGNIWMLDIEKDRLRYLSDRWEKTTIGYEERDGVTLAQTPPEALGILGFGDSVQVERRLQRRFRWHVTDETLDGTGPVFGPVAEATALSESLYSDGGALRTVLAVSQPQPGCVAADAKCGAAPYDALLERVAKGVEHLKAFEKTLHIDRLRLGLLAGAPDTDEDAAATHYADVAENFSRDLKALTGQIDTPAVVVVQSAGKRTDGTSEVILAEGRFDLDNPTLNAVVSTPAYPWSLMEDMPATHSREAALIIDELCVLAVAERQKGKPWHCPALQWATLNGQTITARFSTMAGLTLEDGPHGFQLIGQDPIPIRHVEVVSDTEVRLELESAPPRNQLFLAYAWGFRANGSAGQYGANHGGLRDRWSQPSAMLPGQMLYRYALSGKVPLRAET